MGMGMGMVTGRNRISFYYAVVAVSVVSVVIFT
jgi:hypothetical protein